MQQQCTTALKNAKKIQNIKKSDLNQKKSHFFDFLLKIMIFSNPAQSWAEWPDGRSEVLEDWEPSATSSLQSWCCRDTTHCTWTSATSTFHTSIGKRSQVRLLKTEIIAEKHTSYCKTAFCYKIKYSRLQ